MGRFLIVAISALMLVGCDFSPPPSPDARLKPPVDQGPNWTLAARKSFYSTDQGSRLMPLSWFMALKQADGRPFLPAEEGLSRYGYLKNHEDPTTILPVGFTVNKMDGLPDAIGLSCAACHTREIFVEGKPYRLDGGPAIADFQSFMWDIDRAVARALGNRNGAFKEFATAVLRTDPTPKQLATLRKEVNDWFVPYHTIVDRALPKPPHQQWGPSRLDAVGMIFNRLAGLDIGPAKNRYIIKENIRPALAATRYPFVWDAPRQNKTQWPGFAVNGNSLLGLARNTGEVIGVFALFHPQPGIIPDFRTVNSANIQGLMKLEDLVLQMGRPAYQWPVDAKLVARGKEIYGWEKERGGCIECHPNPANPAIAAKTLPHDYPTWVTPLVDVGTDTLEHETLQWQVDTGVLAGKGIPPLKKRDAAFSLLKVAVVGTIASHLDDVVEGLLDGGVRSYVQNLKSRSRADQSAETNKSFDSDPTAPGSKVYEARVLTGIWSAAPYLHNGSVPTLWDLLEPVEKRPTAFQIGPNYVPTGKVGLAADQPKFKNFTLKTTGCDKVNSGVSNCGHTYGTQLSSDDKWALIEYLKTL